MAEQEKREIPKDEILALIKLEDDINELRRVVKNLSDEVTKLVAATVDITSKLTEFTIKQDYIYKMLLELVDLLKKAAMKEEDPLLNALKENQEQLKRIEVVLRKIHSRLILLRGKGEE